MWARELCNGTILLCTELLYPLWAGTCANDVVPGARSAFLNVDLDYMISENLSVSLGEAFVSE